MAGLLDFLQERGTNALGLLQRIGPLGGLLNPSALQTTGLGAALGDTAHGVSRGMSADLLGAPVDLAAQLMSVPRYLGAPLPDFARSQPVGGSDWIGRKMESVGLLRPTTGSANEIAGRLLGGVLSSPGSVAAVGSGVESGILNAMKNAQIPNRMPKQAGMINLADTRYVMPDGKRLGGVNDSTHESIAQKLTGNANPDEFIANTGAVRMNIAADMVSGRPYTVDIAKQPTESQFKTIVEYIHNAKKPVTIYTPTNMVEISPSDRAGMELRRILKEL
jgi:hypothetical protein